MSQHKQQQASEVSGEDLSGKNMESEKPEGGAIELPEVADWLKAAIQPIKGNSVTGIGLEDVKYDAPERAQYNSLAREIKKTRSKDIDFDKCVDWARGILETHSKDLWVASSLATAILWSKSRNETEKLEGFRDALLLIDELLNRYGDSLYPSKGEEKSIILSSFANNLKLNRLTKIETEHKKELFEITDHVLLRLEEAKVPASVRNRLNLTLKNHQFQGETSFINGLNDEVLNELKSSDESLSDDKLLRYRSAVLDAARKPVEYPQIRFRLSPKTLDALEDSEVPQEILTKLSAYLDTEAVGEDNFVTLLGKLWKDDEVIEFRPLILDYSNLNRWLFLEIEAVFERLDATCSSIFKEDSPDLSLLKKLILEKAAESRGSNEATKAEAIEKEKTRRQRILELEKELLSARVEIENLKVDNDELKQEVETLLNENKSLELKLKELDRSQVKQVEKESVLSESNDESTLAD